MLVAPYLAFFVFIFWSAAVSVKFPEKVSRNGVYYCSIDYEPMYVCCHMMWGWANKLCIYASSIRAIPAYSAVVVFLAVAFQCQYLSVT